MVIYVCVGSACHLKGSYNIIGDLQKMIEEKKLGDKITIKAALCLGKCTEGVSVRVDDNEVVTLSEETVKNFFEALAEGIE